MNIRPIIHLLLAAMLLAGPAQFTTAAPPTPAVAPKPKLTPRAIPGMSAPADGEGHAPLAAKKSAPRTSSATAATSATAPARIVMIYRSGTVELPPVATAPPVKNAPEEARPSTAPVPRPGFVRVISKAEADAIAAQPNP